MEQVEKFEIKGRLESISFGLSFTDVSHEAMRTKLLRTNLQLEAAQVGYDFSASAPADDYGKISARYHRSVPDPNRAV